MNKGGTPGKVQINLTINDPFKGFFHSSND